MLGKTRVKRLFNASVSFFSVREFQFMPNLVEKLYNPRLACIIHKINNINFSNK